MTARRFALGAWTLAGAIAVVVGGAYAAGLRLNTTASAPRGLWRIAPIDPARVKRGDMVCVCPPVAPVMVLMRQRGYIGPGDCPETQTEPLLKPVVAVAGDQVRVQAGGPVAVNGTPLPNSAPLPSMPAWPAGSYEVPPGQVWLLSSYDPGSFDSRYFGPVPAANIRGQAIPVLIAGDARRLTVSPALHLADAEKGE
jgi:conjugative transfer signal peptidase TraF